MSVQIETEREKTLECLLVVVATSNFPVPESCSLIDGNRLDRYNDSYSQPSVTLVSAFFKELGSYIHY